MVNTLRRAAILSIAAATLSTSNIKPDAGVLAIAAGTATAAAVASIAETVSARRASARLQASGVGSHLQSAGSNLKQAAIDVGHNIKQGAEAIKRGVQTGTFTAKETIKAESARGGAQDFFARHGVMVSALLSISALLLGGLWLNARQGK